MMSAEDCAREIVAATHSRTPLLITPSWYRPIYFLRKFFPNLVDKLVAKVA
jgi:short-subunit dehydrogenase